MSSRAASRRSQNRARGRARRPRRNGQIYSIGRAPLVRSSGIPPRFRARLTYNEQFTGSPSAGSSDGYVLSMQNLYDPRFASGGHQPQYFDQLAALWTYFIVKSVTIRLTVSPDNDPAVSGSTTNNVYQAAAIIAPFTNTSGTRPSAAGSDMLEWPGNVTRPLVTGGSAATLRLHVNLPRLLGISWKSYRSNPAFWGTNGGSPSTLILFAFAGVISQGSGAPLPSLCDASIEFEAEFFLPQTLATS